jgi:Na+-driven multidrug efflux pump
MRGFAELPEAVKVLHIAALCCIGFTVILLMAPASIHRIAFDGQDDPAFLKVASRLVIAAPLPLAFGIALDTFVAACRALESYRAASLLGFVAIVVLLGTWYIYPLAQRVAKKRRS